MSPSETRVSLHHTGWGDGGEWDKAYDYFNKAWDNVLAWIYLALHGTYGVLWILKSRYFGDLAGLWERFTLVLLNPRGTGNSARPKDSGAYQIEDYVADLEELRVHLGLERLLLLGHSHGGVVAQAYAARHPGRVERLVLASTLARSISPRP